MEWSQLYVEASRWEHALSDSVLERLEALLEHPSHSPYGNPVPSHFQIDWPAPSRNKFVLSVKDYLIERGSSATVTLVWIQEGLQSDPATLRRLELAKERNHIRASSIETGIAIPSARDFADQLFVTDPA